MIPFRLLQILGVLARHFLARGLGGLLRRVPGTRGWLAPQPSAPESFRHLLEKLGGTFIKFGQVMALQPDLMPREYCDALFDLMDRVPPFPYTEVEEVFRREFGRTPEQIFDSFALEPMGAASIGQVHVALLGERKLAVKVQRPNAEKMFGSDIRLMKFTLKWMGGSGGPFHWLARPLEEFVGWTGEELDYRVEARYMSQLAENSRTQEFESVPDVVWELTTPRVLVADFLEGVTLLDYLRGREKGDVEMLERLEADGFEAARFSENVLENFLGDVFRHGLFHADLHPANLLILPGNVVGYVDFGICGAISRYARRHIMGAVLALTRDETDALARHFGAISRLGPDFDGTAFRRALRDLSDRWVSTEPRASYSVIMLDMLRLCRRHDLIPHGETVRYLRSVVTADGLMARVAPEVDIDEVLERFCSQLLASESLESAFATDRVIDSWAAASRLLEDGMVRLDSLLGYAEGKEDEGGASAEPARVDEGLQIPALAALMAVAGLLLSVAPEPQGPGLNLFTAELALLFVAAILFVRSVLRWLVASS